MPTLFGAGKGVKAINMDESNTLKALMGKLVISRYVILLVDLFLCASSFLVANLLRFNFDIPWYVEDKFLASLGFTLLIRTGAFYIFKSYSGIIKYTSEKDARRVFMAMVLSTTVLMLFNRHTNLLYEYIFLPVSVVIIDFVMAFFLLMLFKVGTKWLYSELKRGMFNRVPQKHTVIYGAGRSGFITKRAIDNDNHVDMRVVAFFDDNPSIQNKFLEGVRIYPLSDFKDVVERFHIDKAIISMHHIEPARKQNFINMCLENDVQAMTIPPASRWLHGELQMNQIRKVRIEDLLNREPINLQSVSIQNQVQGKRILITGAAGSIGSEIVRQLTGFAPSLLVLIDNAESPLVELQLQIEEEFGFGAVEAEVADVTNFERMDVVFSRFNPQIVFHAAAYKHVPIMERQPYEAVRVNVKGTKTLADLSLKHEVERFVMVSTDKAVNPTNVMGASKRIAEIYIQALNNYLKDTQSTRFITTRFGNVLGSNGSVIPRFKKQIAAGGPVTVTNPQITRYFMTIPEACQLVLEAGAMGNGGEIFIFDMGESVRIADLAEKMIKLSGLTPGKDIEIVYTGLRPGEKIKEELLSQQENTLPTHHQKIMVAKVREYHFQTAKAEIDVLLDLLQNPEDELIVKQMKTIVPEYISNNSIFNKLDSEIGKPV